MQKLILCISTVFVLSGCSTLGLENQCRAEQLELKALSIPPALDLPDTAE